MSEQLAVKKQEVTFKEEVEAISEKQVDSNHSFPEYFFSNELNWNQTVSILIQAIQTGEFPQKKNQAALLTGESWVLSLLSPLSICCDYVIMNDICPSTIQHIRFMVETLLSSPTIADFRYHYLLFHPLKKKNGTLPWGLSLNKESQRNIGHDPKEIGDYFFLENEENYAAAREAASRLTFIYSEFDLITRHPSMIDLLTKHHIELAFINLTNLSDYYDIEPLVNHMHETFPEAWVAFSEESALLFSQACSLTAFKKDFLDLKRERKEAKKIEKKFEETLFEIKKRVCKKFQINHHYCPRKYSIEREHYLITSTLENVQKNKQNGSWKPIKLFIPNMHVIAEETIGQVYLQIERLIRESLKKIQNTKNASEAESQGDADEIFLTLQEADLLLEQLTQTLNQPDLFSEFHALDIKRRSFSVGRDRRTFQQYWLVFKLSNSMAIDRLLEIDYFWCEAFAIALSIKESDPNYPDYGYEKFCKCLEIICKDSSNRSKNETQRIRQALIEIFQKILKETREEYVNTISGKVRRAIQSMLIGIQSMEIESQATCSPSPALSPSQTETTVKEEEKSLDNQPVFPTLQKDYNSEKKRAKALQILFQESIEKLKENYCQKLQVNPDYCSRIFSITPKRHSKEDWHVSIPDMRLLKEENIGKVYLQIERVIRESLKKTLKNKNASEAERQSQEDAGEIFLTLPEAELFVKEMTQTVNQPDFCLDSSKVNIKRRAFSIERDETFAYYRLFFLKNPTLMVVEKLLESKASWCEACAIALSIPKTDPHYSNYGWEKFCERLKAFWQGSYEYDRTSLIQNQLTTIFQEILEETSEKYTATLSENLRKALQEMLMTIKNKEVQPTLLNSSSFFHHSAAGEETYKTSLRTKDF